NWNTNNPTDGQVQFVGGSCPSTGCSTGLVAALSTSHTIPVSGLAPGTVYTFQLKSRDSSGSLAPDINRNFTTATATSTTTCGTAPAPTPAAGLVAYWRFDDGAGTDSSGNNLNGTLVNNPSCTSGKIGNALSFNGSNYVSVPASAALGNLTNNFTVTAWISPA